MRGRTRLAGMLVLVAGMGAAWAQASTTPITPITEVELDLGDRGETVEVEPTVDCSDRRPDDDCLSGRLGADQVMQACNGIGPLFGAGSCSTHCQVGSYACGRCGLAGFAQCTCRENFTCNPYAP